MIVSRWTLAIFLAAAGVRGAWTAATSLGPGEIRGDAIAYYHYGANLAETGAMVQPNGRRSERMPLYPAFLAAVFKVAGPSVAAAQSAQALLGAGTCALIYRGGLAILSPPAALFAGWAAVFYYGLVDPCGRLLSECGYAFTLTLFFSAWFAWRGGGTGAALGLSGAALYLIRPEGAFAALAAAAVGPFGKAGWRRRQSALVLLPLAAAILGWGLRNRAALGSFQPGTTGSGFSLWAALPRTMSEKLGASMPDPRGSAELVEEAARNRYFRDKALEAIASAPAGLVFRAAVFNLVSAFYPFLPRYDPTFALLAPLWLYSFAALRGRRELWPAFILIAAWSGLYVVFGGADSRLRQLYAPLLIWLSAAAFERLRERLAPGKLRAWALGWAGANVLIFVFSPHARRAVLLLKGLVGGR